MPMIPFFVALLSGCVRAPHDRVCDDVLADFQSERDRIQRCDESAECGQVLTGTSCGCTRDWVARLDANPDAFYDLLAEATGEECDIGTTSPCDCPATAGFLCRDHTCQWNYVDDYPYLPMCRADDGDPLTIDAVSLRATEIAVTVSYGGGCEEHEVTLCWPDQTFMESNPVQVALELFHDAHDDACDAWITEERSFSLLPLQQAWKESYGSGPGEIVIHLGSTSVSWKF